MNSWNDATNPSARYFAEPKTFTRPNARHVLKSLSCGTADGYCAVFADSDSFEVQS